MAKRKPIEQASFSETCYRTAYHLIMLDYNQRKSDYYDSAYEAMLDLSKRLASFPSVSGSIVAFASYSLSGQTINQTLSFVLGETTPRARKIRK